MERMEHLRERFAKGLITFIWLNVALVSAYAFIEGVASPWIAVVGSVVIAGAATAVWSTSPTAPATRIITSIALAGLVALLLSDFASTRYIIDIHMYFFATLAIVAGWCDWRAIVANAATTIIHHTVLNFVLPSLVFPDGSDLSRVFIHIAIVGVTTVTLIWLTSGIAKAFAISERAMAAASTAEGEMQRLLDEQRARATEDGDRAERLRDAVAGFRQDVDGLVLSVREETEAMNRTSQNLTGIAAAATEVATQALGRSTEVSEGVQTVHASAEELSNSIRKINTHVAGTRDVVAKAKETVAATRGNVTKLATEAERIGEVVGMIRDIAAQTNLLALNATIEAARAGEMGKGFAVVASEVKNLANQTTKATEDIVQRVSGISDSTGVTVEAIRAIETTIEDVAHFTASIAASVEEQRTVAADIAHHIQRSVTGSGEVMEFAQQSDAAANATDKAASEVLLSAGAVGKATEAVTDRIRGFIDAVAG